MESRAINLAVLVSGSGTTLQNLLHEIAAKRLRAQVKLVLASRADAFALERARNADINTTVVDRREFHDCPSFSTRIFQLIDEAGIDLICLAGWLCLLDIPQHWQHRIMNIHPALLPSFGGRGMYGMKVHQAVLDHGCKVSGCTVHFVDDAYDSGPIVLQRCCPVLDDDTPQTLAARVFEEEKIAYPRAIRLYSENRLKVVGRRVWMDNESG